MMTLTLVALKDYFISSTMLTTSQKMDYVTLALLALCPRISHASWLPHQTGQDNVRQHGGAAVVTTVPSTTKTAN